jgi:uncharacterized RDD family membrane protein YckC
MTGLVQVVPLAYVAGCHTWAGYTLGERVTGVRVVDAASWRRLRRRQAVVRAGAALLIPELAVLATVAIRGGQLNHFFYVAAFVLLVAVANTWAVVDCGAALLDRRRRALHDRAARTVVVKQEWVGRSPST